MSQHLVRSAVERDQVMLLLGNIKMPYVVHIERGAGRSVEQNRLQRLWCREAAEQLQDGTAEEKRGYCKLHFGVPILRGENPDFRESYDRVIKPLSYELKLLAMMEPLDFPITRLMLVGQKKRYLDDVYAHFTGLGVRLTDPDSWENAA